jgi:tetratricopeptide (TPR) repeat protein
MMRSIQAPTLVLMGALAALGAAAAPDKTSTAPTVAAGRSQAEVGRVDFPTSGAPVPQALFLRGLAQLHNFEYEDAAVDFRSAQEADPSFAMAYWGEAMTKNHPIWMEQDTQGARDILNRLAPTQEARLGKAPTQREKGYLRALDILYNSTGTKEQRDFAYAESMAGMHQAYPDDVDAAAFYALALLGTAHAGRDVPTYMRAAAILEEIFCAHPEHPGADHYLIHSYDDPVHAPLGLRAARNYAKIAPAAAHAQHMTSHIFIALGMWDEVIAANETAVAVVNRSRAEKSLPPRACGHYTAWLEYGYLQVARRQDARRLVTACMGAARSDPSPDHCAAIPVDPDSSAVGSATQMWARYLFDSGDASNGLLGWDLPLEGSPSARLTHAFALGLVLAQQGNLPKAREALAEAGEARSALESLLDKQGREEHSERVRARILQDELRAAILAAEKNGEEAVAILRQAAAQEESLPVAFGPPFVDKPAQELLGEILLELGRAGEARVAFQAALSRAPKRALSLKGLQRAMTLEKPPNVAP